MHNNRISESYMTNEILNPIYCISDELFNKLNNDKKIFDYIDNENLSELEKKIKLAVSWVGQSFRKDNMVESYLNLCIAFETLLCYQREFISESLVSQMTEQAAFLTKTTLDDRKKLISEIKKLYGLRSDIAHRGTATITDENFFDLLKIIKSMIKNILILIKEKDIKTSNDLRNYILDLKFSSKIL